VKEIWQKQLSRENYRFLNNNAVSIVLDILLLFFPGGYIWLVFPGTAIRELEITTLSMIWVGLPISATQVISLSGLFITSVCQINVELTIPGRLYEFDKFSSYMYRRNVTARLCILE